MSTESVEKILPWQGRDLPDIVIDESGSYTAGEGKDTRASGAKGIRATTDIDVKHGSSRSETSRGGMSGMKTAAYAEERV